MSHLLEEHSHIFIQMAFFIIEIDKIELELPISYFKEFESDFLNYDVNVK